MCVRERDGGIFSVQDINCWFYYCFLRGIFCFLQVSQRRVRVMNDDGDDPKKKPERPLPRHWQKVQRKGRKLQGSSGILGVNLLNHLHLHLHTSPSPRYHPRTRRMPVRSHEDAYRRRCLRGSSTGGGGAFHGQNGTLKVEEEEDDDDD